MGWKSMSQIDRGWVIVTLPLMGMLYLLYYSGIGKPVGLVWNFFMGGFLQFADSVLDLWDRLYARD
jgi:hypothetical protein